MSEPQQPPVPPYAQPNGGYAQPNGGYAANPAQPQPYPSAQATPQGYPGAQPSGPYSNALAAANPLARVALIVALITLGLGLLVSLLTPIVTMSTGYRPELFQLLAAAQGGIALLGGIAALILGLIALRRPGSHASAGIAVGIGGAGVLGMVVSWLSTLAYSLF